VNFSSPTAPEKHATTPIPGQRAAAEFPQFILSHFSMLSFQAVLRAQKLASGSLSFAKI
jgi:hypothetical protein